MHQKLSSYRLTKPAQEDLEDIWAYSSQRWSAHQACLYLDLIENALDKLLIMPFIARERLDIDPPVRVHTIAEHIIIFRIQKEHLEIIRILGGKQDWPSILKKSI